MLHWTKKTDIAVQELTNKLLASSIVMCCSRGSNQSDQSGLGDKKGGEHASTLDEAIDSLWAQFLVTFFGEGFCEAYHHSCCCRCSQICIVSPLRNSSHPQFGRDEQEIHIFQINLLHILLISSHCVKDVLPISSNSLTSYIHVYATWLNKLFTLTAVLNFQGCLPTFDHGLLEITFPSYAMSPCGRGDHWHLGGAIKKTHNGCPGWQFEVIQWCLWCLLIFSRHFQTIQLSS